MKGKPIFRKMQSSMEKGRTIDACISAEMVLDFYNHFVNISWVQRAEVIKVLIGGRMKLDGKFTLDIKHLALEWLKINRVIYPFDPKNGSMEKLMEKSAWY